MASGDGTHSALTFRLQRRRYALSLRGTCGVQDLGAVRRIPNAPRPWLGLSDWGGRVLNVIDLPAVLRDRAVETARSLVRLRDPHEAIALFVPAHLGLCALPAPPDTGAESLCTALGTDPDSLHWIHLEAVLAACSVQVAR